MIVSKSKGNKVFHPFGLIREGKVVILLDALLCLGEWDEEGLPIIHGDKHRAPLITHQLCNVHLLKSTATYCGLHLSGWRQVPYGISALTAQNTSRGQT